MSKLVIEMPNAQSPGYLYRMKNAMEYNRKLKSRDEMDPGVIDDMVGFLLPYVVEPKDREEARKLMFTDLTEEQFIEMFDALSGKEDEEENPTVAETSQESSEPLEKVEKDLKENSQDGLV